MKSLRQLRDDLTGIRLKATSVSLWSVQATVTEHANRAINDAIATYEMHVTGIYSSLAMSAFPSIVALPPDVGRIIRIEARGDTSTALIRREVHGWNQVRTGQTNLLFLDEAFWPASGLAEFVDVVHESQQQELPADLVLLGAVASTGWGVFNTGDGGFVVTGGNPIANWRAPGYIELSPAASTPGWQTPHEVVRYDFVTPNGFSSIQRAIDGMLTGWTGGSMVSAVYEAPEQTVPVIMAKAQATMYEFFIRNRALYDQYTAIASEQAMSVGDLLGLARAMEDKADRAYLRIKKPPAPSRVRTKVR